MQSDFYFSSAAVREVGQGQTDRIYGAAGGLQRGLLHCRSTLLSLSISFKPDLAKRGGEIILCQA